METYDAVETYDAIATKIGDYLSRNFLFSDQGFNYEDDASFLEQGIIDSYGFIELLHWVEEEFSISVADDEVVPDNFDCNGRGYLDTKLFLRGDPLSPSSVPRRAGR